MQEKGKEKSLQLNELQALKWSGRRDSNSRPFDPQSNALNQAALRPEEALEFGKGESYITCAWLACKLRVGKKWKK
jgi:hypothetical protein